MRTTSTPLSQTRWRFWLLLVQLLLLTSWVASHGYLSTPPPRGILKNTTDIDALKSPNTNGVVCRGEPAGKATSVKSGQQLTLEFTITAPHIGPCSVYILDLDLGNPVLVDTMDGCAAPGKGQPWTVTLPKMTGLKVLQWNWEGQHVSPPEEYTQCVDLDFGGGSGSSSNSGVAPEKRGYNGSNTSDDSDDGSKTSLPSLPTPSATQYGSLNDAAAETPPPSPVYSSPVPATPATGYAPEGGGCSAGAYECRKGNNFVQCDNGTWASLQCAPGTTCSPSGSAILCS